MKGRLILGIETSVERGSLSAAEDGRILGQETIGTRLRHTAMLIPSLDRLLRRIDITAGDIDTIAVDAGPGSFTGIRVGIASALGLALAGGKDITAVSSLEVLCGEALYAGIPENIRFLVPVIDAKRGKVYSALYDVISGRMAKGAHLTTMDLLRNYGEGYMLFGPDINGIFPSAGTLAKTASRKLKDGTAQKKIKPVYLHNIEYKR